MNWYKTSQSIFRGDSQPMNMQDYDPEYGVKGLGKELGSSLAKGPGIYFTTNEEDAQSYGNNVSNFNINNANIISEDSPKFTKSKITNILKSINQNLLTQAFSNWDENPHNGKILLINSIMNTENPIEQLMSIWSDVFSHQGANDFMILMTKNGIDGISIQRPYSKHYVIYNRNILS